MKLMTRPEWQQDWEQIERALRSQLRRRGINARTEAGEETLQEARCLVLDRLAAGKCIALAVWLAAADAARGRRFVRQCDYDSPALNGWSWCGRDSSHTLDYARAVFHVA